MRSVVVSLLLFASFSVAAQAPEGSDEPPELPQPTPEETPVETPVATPIETPLPMLEPMTPVPVATPGLRPVPLTTIDAVKGEGLHRLTSDAPMGLEIVGPMAFRITATQYFPGLPLQTTVLDIVMNGRVLKRSSLQSKVATAPHPSIPSWSVGQAFVVVVPIPEGVHQVSLKLASGAGTSLGLRLGAPVPVAASVASAPSLDGPPSLDTIGPRGPPPNVKPELAYRTQQRYASVGGFTGILLPSIGAGRPPTAFSGVVARYQRTDNIGFGLLVGSATFHEAIPKRRWIGFQLQPILGQGYYHFPVGDHAQPYVVGCAGPVVGRSEMFLVDDTRLEQTVGGAAAIGGGVEYDAFRDSTSLVENRMQVFAEVSTQAIYVPFEEHKRTAFLGGSLTLGAIYKW